MQVLKAMKRVAAVGTGVAMLGATLTGAMALDLSEYPGPFVTGGTYDTSNVLVVGANAAASDTLGMVDIATGLQYESKTCVAGGGTVTVSGGITEDIPLGWAIGSNQSTTLEVELEDDDIDTMFDGEVTFQSANYDSRDILVLGTLGSKFSRLATSLTSSEDDYQTDIVLETDVDAIRYYYVFDEVIAPNATTASEPLEVKFLGKTLKITGIDTTVDNKFTAQVGTEYFMDVGDAVEVDGKTVTLENVGEGGSIIVDVDGVKETIGGTTPETVNGIEIKVDETFYETTKAQRSATLIIGKDAVETYKDGDAYVGEDSDDPDWVWNIGNLNSKLQTTTSKTTEFTGPYLGIENDFVWNDDSDNPAGVGECIDLPNNYLRICLDSLTVKDTDYKTYTFERDGDGDLSEADGGTTTSAAVLYIHTNQQEGIMLDTSEFDINGTTTDPKSDKVWLWKCLNETGGDDDVLGYYYETSDGKTTMAGCSNLVDVAAGVNFADVNYENTKGDGLRMYVYGDDTNFNITLMPYESTDMPNYDDNITMAWTASAFAVSSLGASASSEEAGELTWTGSGDPEIGGSISPQTLGSKDEDHRTRYGIIIRDPKGHGSSDEVVLEIPNDQVQGNIVVKGSAAVTAGGDQTCSVAEITTVTKLDSEIAGSEALYNLILVGGPCANDAVEAVSGLGITCDGWSLKEGEGIVKLAANGEKVAMLVAGTNAMDTRRAAKVVANYADYTLTGTEALVKGTTLTDITVE
ncbi:MAG: hypothetical protein KKA79_07940 [Nanoarchaeota archaeon]|nr:hypothetical protein [Nanoarchaeota archaeon]